MNTIFESERPCDEANNVCKFNFGCAAVRDVDFSLRLTLNKQRPYERFDLTIDPKDMLFTGDSVDSCYVGVFKANVETSSLPVVYLGTLVMNKYYTVFDQDAGGYELKIGFAPRSVVDGAGTKQYDIDAGPAYEPEPERDDRSHIMTGARVQDQYQEVRDRLVAE